MDILEKNKIDLIMSLSRDHQMRILELYHPLIPNERMYFLTGDFRPAEGNINYHELLRCKNITEIVDESSSIFMNSLNFIKSVVDKIDSNINIVNLKLHKDFIYVWCY